MALIFSASADANSAQTSSRFLEPLLRWLFPEISAEALGRAILAVRKLAHVTEYAILAGLCWRALRGGRRGWSGNAAVGAFLISAAYAITDEWHQSFIPNRQGTLTDVLIDMVGAGVALAGIRWFVRRRERKRLEGAESHRP
jgi:VanZ family protein